MCGGAVAQASHPALQGAELRDLLLQAALLQQRECVVKARARKRIADLPTPPGFATLAAATRRGGRALAAAAAAAAALAPIRGRLRRLVRVALQLPLLRLAGLLLRGFERLLPRRDGHRRATAERRRLHHRDTIVRIQLHAGRWGHHALLAVCPDARQDVVLRALHRRGRLRLRLIRCAVAVLLLFLPGGQRFEAVFGSAHGSRTAVRRSVCSGHPVRCPRLLHPSAGSGARSDDAWLPLS